MRPHKQQNGAAQPDEPGARLSAYLDGELPPGQVGPLGAQLAQNPDLARELDALETVDQLLGAWREPQATPDVRRSVMARVTRDLDEASSSRGFWLNQWGRPAWAAVWVVGGLLTGLALLSGVNGRREERLAGESAAQGSVIMTMLTQDAVTFPAFAQSEVEDEQP